MVAIGDRIVNTPPALERAGTPMMAMGSTGQAGVHFDGNTVEFVSSPDRGQRRMKHAAPVVGMDHLLPPPPKGYPTDIRSTRNSSGVETNPIDFTWFGRPIPRNFDPEEPRGYRIRSVANRKQLMVGCTRRVDVLHEKRAAIKTLKKRVEGEHGSLTRETRLSMSGATPRSPGTPERNLRTEKALLKTLREEENSDVPLDYIMYEQRMKNPETAFVFMRKRDMSVTEMLFSMKKGPSRFDRVLMCLGIYWQIEAIRMDIEARKIFGTQYENPYEKIRVYVQTVQFEVLCGLAIMVNSITIGMDTYYTTETRPSYLNTAENVFTLLFLIEWVMRVLVDGPGYFLDATNFIDTLLVWVAGVFVVWFLAFVSPGAADVLRRFTALRILRIARAIRIIRIYPQFRELWYLVQGLVGSAYLLLWVAIVMGSLHVTFGVVVVKLLDYRGLRNEPELATVATLGDAILFGMQLTTFDSYSAPSHAMGAVAFEVLLVFYIFIGCSGLVLLNITTAIVVENTFSAASKDSQMIQKHTEYKQQIQVNLLHVMFMELDEDGTGTLSKKEFTEVLDDPKFIQRIKSLDLDLADLPDVFAICDDGDGLVSAEEFIAGMLKIQARLNKRDMLMMLQVTTKLNKTFIYTMDLLEDSISITEKRTKKAKKLRRDIQILCAQVSAILGAIQMRTVEATAELIQDNPEKPRPIVPILPVADEIRNPSMKKQAFLRSGAKLLQPRNDGVERHVKVTQDQQIWMLGAIARRNRVVTEEESSTEEEVEEEPPPPEPKVITANKHTQTRWRPDSRSCDVSSRIALHHLEQHPAFQRATRAEKKRAERERKIARDRRMRGEEGQLLVSRGVQCFGTDETLASPRPRTALDEELELPAIWQPTPGRPRGSPATRLAVTDSLRPKRAWTSGADRRRERYRVSTADRTWTAETQRLGIDNGWTSELARPPPLDSLREHARHTTIPIKAWHSVG